MGEAERHTRAVCEATRGLGGRGGLCRPSGLLGASFWLPAGSEEFQWEDTELLVARSESGADSEGRHRHYSLVPKIHRD